MLANRAFPALLQPFFDALSMESVKAGQITVTIVVQTNTANLFTRHFLHHFELSFTLLSFMVRLLPCLLLLLEILPQTAEDNKEDENKANDRKNNDNRKN